MSHYTKNSVFSDVTPEGSQPTITDVWRLVVEIRDRLEDVERQQQEHVTAFSVNDLNKPDYDGHRKSHAKLTKADELMSSYKEDVTKKVLASIAIFVLGVFGSGVVTKIAEMLK